MNAKHTLGPLRVEVANEWPFYICTYNNDGELIFRRDMPAYSTKQRTAKQALNGVFMSEDAEEAAKLNARALADEVLRAAAPDLLAAAIRVVNADDAQELTTQDIELLRSAIAKATGQ